MPAKDEYDKPHPTTVKHDWKPGCYNRKSFKPGHYATNRSYDEEGHWKLVAVWVPNVMSKECQVGKEPLSECEECSHVSNG